MLAISLLCAVQWSMGWSLLEAMPSSSWVSVCALSNTHLPIGCKPSLLSSEVVLALKSPNVYVGTFFGVCLCVFEDFVVFMFSLFCSVCRESVIRDYCDWFFGT